MVTAKSLLKKLSVMLCQLNSLVVISSLLQYPLLFLFCCCYLTPNLLNIILLLLLFYSYFKIKSKMQSNLTQS